jgi:hypothetical protein
MLGRIAVGLTGAPSGVFPGLLVRSVEVSGWRRLAPLLLCSLPGRVRGVAGGGWQMRTLLFPARPSPRYHPGTPALERPCDGLPPCLATRGFYGRKESFLLARAIAKANRQALSAWALNVNRAVLIFGDFGTVTLCAIPLPPRDRGGKSTCPTQQSRSCRIWGPVAH